MQLQETRTIRPETASPPSGTAQDGAPAVQAARILVVDDDLPMALGLKAIVEREGHRVDTATSAEEALERLREEGYALVLSDVRMPGASGLDLLDEVRRVDPELPVVLLTGFATVEGAVEAIKRGAFDYLSKPFKIDDVRLVVRRALERRALAAEIAYLRREVVRRFAFGEIVAGPTFAQVLERARRVAPATTSVLITGETGTGKELVAKAIHFGSPRANRPFLAVNCSALTPSLIESELFGHARGAFTGAVEARAGYFEVANGGTLFLDEVGEIPPPIQAKLLRVLQDGSFQRVGDTRARSTDVRVLAATNRDLEDEMRRGRFREDLYYRLAVVHIRIPPLRARREDIPGLARYFLDKYAAELGKRTTRIPDELLARLTAYSWPGNVREFENAIERGVLLAEGEALADDALPVAARGQGEAAPAAAGPQALVSLAEHERAYILAVLKATRNNKNLAAKVLGITRRSLYRKLDKHDLKP